jgi:hypothetical protein
MDHGTSVAGRRWKSYVVSIDNNREKIETWYFFLSQKYYDIDRQFEKVAHFKITRKIPCLLRG